MRNRIDSTVQDHKSDDLITKERNENFISQVINIVFLINHMCIICVVIFAIKSRQMTTASISHPACYRFTFVWIPK